MRYSWVQEPVPLMSAAMNPEKKKERKNKEFQINTSQGDFWLPRSQNSQLIQHLYVNNAFNFFYGTCNYASPLAFNIFSESLYSQILMAEPDVWFLEQYPLSPLFFFTCIGIFQTFSFPKVQGD